MTILKEFIHSVKLLWSRRFINSIDKLTWVNSKTELVLCFLTGDGKVIVRGIRCLSFGVFQIDTKPKLRTVSQAVYLVQSQPKFSIQITKPYLVVGPAKEEINRTVLSLLELCPPPTGCLLVTEHIKGTWAIRIDCINTADSLTGFVQLSTVLVNCEKKLKKDN